MTFSFAETDASFLLISSFISHSFYCFKVPLCCLMMLDEGAHTGHQTRHTKEVVKIRDLTRDCLMAPLELSHYSLLPHTIATSKEENLCSTS